ncbi:probable E3 ubiquitin-protein ligase ATL44 [Setaria viridis]|uniref:probable E3 ubiquitin-protein ligase ATL44 n=1 Tax=Setaria viridis TaxID=4556 RepID=UPI001493B015|nr:probable E3 ubiquitin-protein ligase ATL44 [Setaria viridis]
MRVFGGGCAREHYASGRSLLGAAPPVPAPSLEAQRAHLERVLGATAIVLFLASVSYVTLTAIFGFLCAGGGSRRPDGGTGAPEPAAAEETKRALEEIPVVVVAVPVPDPDRSAEGEECAVCLAEYACGEEVRVLPACRHGFHRECVDRWLLTRAPTCPVCRAPVATRPEGHGGKACATGDAALPAIAVGP